MNGFQQRIIVLWTAFLLGLIFHAQLGLMPLFHGLSVAEPANQATNLSNISLILRGMLGFFLVPLFATVATALTNAHAYRKLHFGLTVVYSLMNFAHLLADLLVQPVLGYQITLMGILFLIGLLLNGLAWQWMTYSPSK